MKTNKLLVFLALFVAFNISSCTHLTRSENATVVELSAYGVRPDSGEQVANPVLAGVLNILPGFGNFYLASGNAGESGHWVYGILNLITWPVSVLWGVPEAAIDAGTINKREMVYYYTFDPKGKKELEALRKEYK